MKVKTLIVDDEKMARRELVYLLDQDQRFEVGGEAASGRKAIASLKESDFGLVLLDIKMPGVSGIEVARFLDELKDPPHLVFTTAYDEYAIEAFQLAAVDYLLKPISEERFVETLDRVWKQIDENEVEKVMSEKIDSLLDMFDDKKVDPGKVAVEDNGRYRLLDYESVFYFSTAEKKVRAHTESDSFPTNFKLKDLEDRLPSYFFRVHRSYIVNLSEVKEVIPWFKGKYQVVMADSTDHEIPVSRSKVKKLNQLLNLK